MNFGMMDSFRNSPWSELPYAELYRKHLDLAVETEDLGYDTFWFTEHHFVQDGYSPSILPLAAAMATRTRKIRIGTYVLLMPLHHPLRVAEDAATVDVLSNGRFDLGLGQGYRPEEFAGYNVARKERSSRLHEGVEIIRRAWTEENFSFDGKYTRVSNVTVYPKAVQQPHPPIWIAARSRSATEWVARNGYHLAGSGGLGTPGETRQSQIYRDALKASGRNPDDYNVAQVRFVYVAATREKAWNDAEPAVHYMLSSMGKWLADANDLPGDSGFRNVPPVGELRKMTGAEMGHEAPMIGSPDDVIRILEQWLAIDHFTHLALEMGLPGIEPRKLRASMKLFAKEVIPHFRRKSRAAKTTAS